VAGATRAKQSANGVNRVSGVSRRRNADIGGIRIGACHGGFHTTTGVQVNPTDENAAQFRTRATHHL
jgi:hypothetical protein